MDIPVYPSQRRPHGNTDGGSYQEMLAYAGDASSLLKALANDIRLMILCHLVDGEMSVGALNERIPISQSALSQHLAILRRDQLVTTRREAQTVYYALRGGKARSILQVLHALYCRAKGPELVR